MFVFTCKINVLRRFWQVKIILIGVLISMNSMAHPHSWVDINTEIQGDSKHITGFKMAWTFDAMTSAYMLDGEDLSADNKAQTLQTLTDSIMENMIRGHYLTYFYNDDIPVKYALAQNAVLTQKKMMVTLSFYLPLAKPLAWTDKPLKLRIYDPSYYVDMSWPKKTAIQFVPALAKNCKLELFEATPTSEQLAYVMSLAVDTTRDDALGELFTQSVVIKCKD